MTVIDDCGFRQVRAGSTSTHECACTLTSAQAKQAFTHYTQLTRVHAPTRSLQATHPPQARTSRCSTMLTVHDIVCSEVSTGGSGMAIGYSAPMMPVSPLVCANDGTAGGPVGLYMNGVCGITLCMPLVIGNGGIRGDPSPGTKCERPCSYAQTLKRTRKLIVQLSRKKKGYGGAVWVWVGECGGASAVAMGSFMWLPFMQP